MKAHNVISFEFEKEERVYRFLMPDGAPLGEAYEAVTGFLTEMVKLVNDHHEGMKLKQDEKEAAEEQE